ncbi:hypothetical protein OROGR_013480 [Orobanche gracilis]
MSKISKKDKAWNYAYQLDGEKCVRCKFCHHKSNDGVTRLKNHLAQTHKGVAPCPNSSYFESGEGSSQGNVSNINQGTLDNFVKSAPRQTTINSAYKKELLNDVKRRVGRFIYSVALPFNVVNDPYWLPMIDGIAEYGKGFKPPYMHELRTWVLKAKVDDINIIYEDHKKAWKTYGCTIISDGWTDQKQRALMNFLVNSPAGTFFIKSVDVSDSIKNGELIFKYLDEVIDEVGEDNVIQIVTDNASNCKNAGRRIMEARKSLWWTPCAAHCIDLMLEDIAKLKIFEEAIENAKKVVKFIYGHGTILALMRKHTNDKELLRPAVTRFGSKTPELTSFAIRVLSLMCSASGCERNWSTFENRLEHKRLNALVYVKYNLRLRERSIKRRNKIDPIVVDEIDSDDEWITEKEDPVLPEKPSWLENDDLFSGDPIVSVPSYPFDNLIDSDKRVELEVVDGDKSDDDTPRVLQKRIIESSSGSKCKKTRMELIDEDVELEDHGGINPRNFDSGKSATIETIDDDSELEDCLKQCITLIKKGVSVFFFPEGTRSKDGKLGPFKKGAFSVAAKTGVPVVPITLIGTGEIMPAGMEGELNPGSVKVIVHPSIIGNNPDELCSEARNVIARGLIRKG